MAISQSDDRVGGCLYSVNIYIYVSMCMLIQVHQSHEKSAKPEYMEHPVQPPYNTTDSTQVCISHSLCRSLFIYSIVALIALITP